MKKIFSGKVILFSVLGVIVDELIYLLKINDFPSFNIPEWIIFGLLGLAGGLLFLLIIEISKALFNNLYLEEISVSVPKIGNVKIRVNREYKLIAWNLFIESITRIATQPLKEDQGILSESADSLYSLFTTTRELLKTMKPSKTNGEMTVELLAVKMLNDELRPFLSKWHPKIVQFNKKITNQNEREWEYEEEYRKELENLRKNILSYTKAFGKLSGVHDLEKYFEN